MKTKILIIILIAGLLTACGSQPTETPASPLTDEPAQPTEVPTNTPLPLPTDTAIPTDTAVPSQETATSPVTFPPPTVSFASDIFPLLKSRCGNCHGGGKKEAELSILTYASLMTGSENGPVIIPGNAEKSLLVDQVSSQEMPKKGPKLTPPQVQLIIDWVNQGALDN